VLARFACLSVLQHPARSRVLCPMRDHLYTTCWLDVKPNFQDSRKSLPFKELRQAARTSVGRSAGCQAEIARLRRFCPSCNAESQTASCDEPWEVTDADEDAFEAPF
jgi:hypothetical protein